jgi:hypothetical protein
METELLKKDYFSTHVLYIHLYLCVFVRECVLTCMRTQKDLFILYGAATSKLLSTMCVGHFTFSNKINTHEIIFARKHVYFHPFIFSIWQLCSVYGRGISRTASLL